MQVIMLVDIQSSPNGIQTRLYTRGEVYAVGEEDMPERLAQSFLKGKQASVYAPKQQGKKPGPQEVK